MRPTKNRIYCYAAKKAKMLFESESKADNFIKYNGDEILEETGKAPVRSYYCKICGGFHVTSNPSTDSGEFLDRQVERKLSQIQSLKQKTKKIGELCCEIHEEIDKILGLLNFGFIKDAQILLEKSEIKLNDVSKLGLLSGKYATTRAQLDEIYASIVKIEELVEMNDNDLASYIETKDKKNQEFPTRQTAVNILSVRVL